MTQKVGIELLVNDGSLVSGFDKAIAKAGEYDNQTSELIKTMSLLNKTIADSIKADEDKDKSLRKTVEESKKAIRETEDYTKAVRKSISSFTVFGVSIDSVKTKLKDFRDSLKGSLQILRDQTKLTTAQKRSIIELNNQFGLSRKSLVNLAKSFRVLRVAIIGTGIGALIIALGSLISFITTTQEGSEKLGRVFAQVGAVTEFFVDKINDLGKAVLDDPLKALSNSLESVKSGVGVVIAAFNLFRQGQFEAAFTVIKESAKAASEGIREVIEDAGILADVRVALEKQEIALRSEYRKTRAEIKELNKEGENVNNTYQERKKALEEAFRLERNLLERRIGLSEENLELVKEEIRLNSDNDKVEGLRKIAEAEERLAQVQEESFELQTTLQNKINALNKERTNEVASLKKEIEGIVTELISSTDSINENNDPVLKILNERERSIAKINANIKRFQELALRLNISDEEVQKVVGQFQNLINLVNQETEKELRELRTLDEVELLPSKKLETDTDLLVNVNTDIAEPQKVEDSIRQQLSNIFGKVDEVFSSEEFGVFQDVIGNVADAFVANVDRQLSELDRLSEQRRERIEELESDLEKEEELRLRGFAVNVEGKQNELDELLRLEEEDEKKREELKKQKIRAQLIQDTITQASSLATAVAEIFKANAGIPFVGIGLAITAIAGMFAAFAKARQQAAEVTSLYTGSDRLYDDIGQIAPGEGSDVPGRGRPEFRIVDRKGNTRAYVGGEEILVDGQTSNSHGKVFKWIKDNKHKINASEMLSLLEGRMPSFDASNYAPSFEGIDRLSNDLYNSFVVNNNIDIDEIKIGKQFEKALNNVISKKLDKLINKGNANTHSFEKDGKRYVSVKS